MWIIGCDYHPSFQQIAFVNLATGERGSRRLEHKGGDLRDAPTALIRSILSSDLAKNFQTRRHKSVLPTSSKANRP